MNESEGKTDSLLVDKDTKGRYCERRVTLWPLLGARALSGGGRKKNAARPRKPRKRKHYDVDIQGGNGCGNLDLCGPFGPSAGSCIRSAWTRHLRVSADAFNVRSDPASAHATHSDMADPASPLKPAWNEPVLRTLL